MSDVNIPPGEGPGSNDAPQVEQPDPPGKKNRTPDLDDEQYMEQLFLIAQAITVMPAQREGMPNIATPPPIRPRWAAFLLSLGLRIDPRLATHKLANPNEPAAGNWGPREHVELGGRRQSMNRADLLEVWKRINPESYEGIRNGTLTREDLAKTMPAQVQQAATLAAQLREQEVKEAAAGDVAT